jgi:phosphoglycolate phosphatase
MISPKLFIFDLDGTLYDSLRSWVNTQKRIGKQLKVPISEIPIGLFGKSIKEWIKTLFPKRKRKKAKELFFGKERKRFLSGFKLFLDTKSLLEYLKKRGIKIAVTTGLDKNALDIVFKKDGIGKFIDVAITAEEIKKEKPNPEMLFQVLKKFKLKPGEAIYVADAPSDIKMAKKAKMKIAVITRGAITDPKFALKFGADYVFADFSQLINFLSKL